jgi:predicted lipid-binding transport protein (Tim44 family)
MLATSIASKRKPYSPLSVATLRVKVLRQLAHQKPAPCQGARLFRNSAFDGDLFSLLVNNSSAAAGFRSLGSSAPPLEIKPEDYEAFERLLGEIQSAWSDEDVSRLERLATPEMTSYFARDLADNKARNAINKVSDVKLLQGDLAEAWREGDADYATVALRFSLVDKTFDRNNNQVIAGGDQPTEATVVWTFVRNRGGNWELSAIQQTN